MTTSPAVIIGDVGAQLAHIEEVLQPLPTVMGTTSPLIFQIKAGGKSAVARFLL